MTQHLNLYHQRFAPPAMRVSARFAVAAVVLTLGLGMVLSQGLQLFARQTVVETDTLQASNLPLRDQLLARARMPQGNDHDSAAELYMLRVMEAGQRRIRAALEAGVAGNNEGHAGYLSALARQASPKVWITGFSVAEGGDNLALQGRMAAAHALTDYLRGLNAEPRFKGRPFAQLSLSAVNGSDGQPAYTEFSLLASPAPTPVNGQPAPVTGLPAATPNAPLQAQR